MACPGQTSTKGSMMGTPNPKNIVGYSRSIMGNTDHCGHIPIFFLPKSWGSHSTAFTNDSYSYVQQMVPIPLSRWTPHSGQIQSALVWLEVSGTMHNARSPGMLSQSPWPCD